jgi:hypothetical protein
MFCGEARGWSPGVSDPDAAGSPAIPLVVDASVRNDVVSFFHCIYKASVGGNAEIGWTGHREGCVPGTTSEVFKDHVRRRINWYRAMSGMSGDVVFDPAFNTAAQAAALIMAKEEDLSHNPAAEFGKVGCWTAAGQTGASRGNLYLGRFGVTAIDGYIDDYGIADVGHRAWLLYPRATKMGTGDVPDVDEGWSPSTNCLYVIDDPSRRAASRRFHAWPPAGYVPAISVYPLWSLQFDSANFGSPTFGAAAVTMTVGATNTPVPLVIRHRYSGGGLAGAPSIVWEPDWKEWGGRPPLETPIRVNITGITAGASGSGGSHAYTVTCIDPFTITDPLTIKGPAEVPTDGANYTFDGLTGVSAERYELGVARVREESVIEGAEADPAPRVVDGTSGGYALMTVPANGIAAQAGQRCFHLAIPSFSEWLQSFELDYDIVPAASASLSFYRRYGAVGSGTRFSIHAWSDSEADWKELSGRSGPGGAGWVRETVSLDAYAGQSIRLRFQLAWETGPVYVGTTPNYGILIDSIEVTGAENNAPYVITPLASDSRQFTLNASTAGTPLAPGSEWWLRIRPTLGLNTFPFASAVRIAVQAPVGPYAQWMTSRFPSLTPPGFSEDPDGDGLANGVEYAFGLDPTQSGGTPPALKLENGSWILAFDPATLPYPVSDITYEAESSAELESWTRLPAETTGSRLVFRLPAGDTHYVRWVLSKAP